MLFIGSIIIGCIILIFVMIFYRKRRIEIEKSAIPIGGDKFMKKTKKRKANVIGSNRGKSSVANI